MKTFDPNAIDLVEALEEAIMEALNKIKFDPRMLDWFNYDFEQMSGKEE